MTVLAVRICGIPAQVEVTHYQPPYQGSAWNCDSSDDYYGWSEYEVLDRNGRPAGWLEKKMTPKDRSRIEGEIAQRMKEKA